MKLTSPYFDSLLFFLFLEYKMSLIKRNGSLQEKSQDSYEVLQYEVY